MNSTLILSELQKIDLQGDENASNRQMLAKRLADGSAVASAQNAANTIDKRLTTLHAQLKALELETGTLEDKIKQVDQRLYSGRIANPKELAGLEQDEKMLKRRKSELEDQELELMTQIEGVENEAKATRAASDKVSAQWGDQNAHDRAALYELDAADAELGRKRGELRAQLPVETLRLYDDLRKTKKGRAVAALRAGACGACGYEVPSGLVSRIKLGNEMVTCGNCGRILTGG